MKFSQALLAMAACCLLAGSALALDAAELDKAIDKVLPAIAANVERNNLNRKGIKELTNLKRDHCHWFNGDYHCTLISTGAQLTASNGQRKTANVLIELTVHVEGDHKNFNIDSVEIQVQSLGISGGLYSAASRKQAESFLEAAQQAQQDVDLAAKQAFAQEE